MRAALLTVMAVLTPCLPGPLGAQEDPQTGIGAESTPSPVIATALRVVEAEIDGKVQASNAYDRLVWTVRTGFFTLVFGAAAVLLKGLVDKPNWDTASLLLRLQMLLALATILAIPAGLQDRRFLVQKYRVVEHLDAMYELVSEAEEDESPATFLAAMQPYLTISGEADTPVTHEGYAPAVRLALMIYGFPLAGLGLVTAVFWRRAKREAASN